MTKLTDNQKQIISDASKRLDEQRNPGKPFRR
jgi:hypothetical protein